MFRLSMGLVAVCVALPACSSSSGQNHDQGSLGSVSIKLALPNGQVLNNLTFTLTDAKKMTVKTGTINIGKSQSIDFQIGGVPAGAGYAVGLVAASDDGSTCSGSTSPFNVAARATTTVIVNMACYARAPDAGNVAVNATLFSCATWTSLATVNRDGSSVNGSEADVGSAVTLFASATGPDPAKLSYAWSTSNAIGRFGAQTNTGTTDTITFSCVVPGTTTITLVVADGPVPAGSTCSTTDSTVKTVVTCDAGTPFQMGPGTNVTTKTITAAIKGGSATATYEADSVRQHSILDVLQQNQSVFSVETWALASGAIPLLIEKVANPPILLQLASPDGVNFMGTFNGRDLQPFPLKNLSSFLGGNGGIRYSDGTLIGPLGDITAVQQAVSDAVAALNQALSSNPTSSAPLAPAGGAPPSDPPPYTPLAPTTEDTHSASPCTGCTGTALATLGGCIAGAAIGATGCTGFYDGLGYAICFAAGAATCSVVWAVQNGACYNQGSGCCPTACGASGCCLAGHTCAGGGSGAPALCCAGHTCGAGCCSNVADVCFEAPPTGQFQCCPAGQPLFAGPGGTQICCQIGDTFNPTTNECCPAGSGDCSTCGHSGQSCCAGNRCLDSGIGCDSTGQCVACPAVAGLPQQLDDQSIFDGNNCFGVNNVHTVGRACDPGFHRVSFETTVVSASSDTSCVPSWASSDPSDCTVNVAYVTPADCFKGIVCDTKVFESNVPTAPGPQVAAELNLFDGNNCFGVNNDHTFGGPCDPGFHRVSFNTTVISSSTDSSCTPRWASSDPNDCTVIVNYQTPADCFKGITCDTQVLETNVTTSPPIGCP